MTDAAASRPGPRIGVAYPGDPASPSSWSGAPAGLISGLEAAGAAPVPLDARFPGSARLARGLRLSWSRTSASDAFAAASSLAVRRRARRARLDGAVAIGSGFVLPAAPPSVTYDDMTVAQALRRDDPAYRELSARAAARWRERQARIYERARACCVASSWTAASLRSDYGVPEERIHVVGFGRNVDAASPPERDWSEPRFIFAGIDWERKRGDAVVSAFAALRERHPRATLDLVGGHPPVEAPGVTGHGRLRLDSPSEQRRYAELLARSTCFVMPSAYEPFGIAHLDAGAHGLPSIGTTVGGAVDAVGPGGVLVDPGDDGALLAAMLDLAEPETARELGILAAAHSARHTWRAVAERVLQALLP